MNKYEIISHLCESMYANIYKAVTKNKEVVALKVIELDRTGIPCDALKEIFILKQLNSIYIINLLEYYIYVDNIVLVMPYADYTLKEYNLNFNINTEDIFKQITLALNYCHSNFIIHRDVKPENILIINNTVKLADFGLAKYDFFKEDKSSNVVTLWYRAPEVLLNLPYNYKIDVWSLGCIYYELLYKQVLFKGKDVYDQLYLIDNKPQFSNLLLDKMLKLSSVRIDTEDILKLID